jgi:parallel beta helix pectate lyase-like protein
VKIPLGRRIRRGNFLYFVIAGVLVIVLAVTVPLLSHSSTTPAAAAGPGRPTPVALRVGTQVCGQPILRSPFSYDGAAGRYPSGRAGLPTYGTPGSDFPDDTAGVIVATGANNYLSYQLSPDTVYYLLPGTHVGNFQADTDDAFVGGLSGSTQTVLTGNYNGLAWGIDSNSSIGDQADVTIEYLTVEKFQPDGNSAAINPDSNTGWTIRYDTITLNVPGAGVILGSDNVLADNCLTLNGQYGFQSVAVNPWGQDSLTGGPYNLTVKDNEISYNDTCDFEGLLDNPAIGWSGHNPVPAQYRNSRCGPVTPDGDEGGFKLWHTDGVTIRDNYMHDNWGPAAWADTDNANTTYTGNVMTDNDGGIIEEISYNFSITGNYLADNGWAEGLGNPDFPSAVIYVSESGSDRTFGGVPACPEAPCAHQRSYSARSVITGNTMIDNGGGVFLWQDSNRYCSDSSDSVCTLVDGGPAGPFTLSGCKSNLPSASIDKATYTGKITGSPPQDWWDGCMWRTENVSVSHNVIDFNPADITDCNRADWPDCGAGGMFSEYGSVAPYNRAGLTLTQLTFFQHNSWSDNTYDGPSIFYAWNQGNGDNPVSWAEWTGRVSKGDRCSSAGERSSGACKGPFGQDAGSTYTPTPHF